MNIIFRKLFKKYIRPEEESEVLVNVISTSAFEVFRDRSFRKIVEFEKQNEEERNRIFNELVVTGLVYLVHFVKDRLPFIKEERAVFWKDVKNTIPDSFIQGLNKIGIDGKYVELWDKLFKLRIEEYREKQSMARQAWSEEFSKEKKNEKLEDDLVRLETLTISSMFHITRGKAKKDSPLRKHLRTWLSALNYKLEKRVGW